MEKYVRLNTRGSSGQSVQGSTEQKAEPTAHPLSPSLLFCFLSFFSLYPSHPTLYIIRLAVTFPHSTSCTTAPSNFQREKLVELPGDVSELPQTNVTAQQGGKPLHRAAHVAGHAFKSELNMCLQIVLNLK